MSSGLRFSFSEPSLAQLFLRGIPDHVRIYTGIEDVFRFAIAAPAEHPAGRVGRYRNSDPLVLLAIMHREPRAWAAGGRGRGERLGSIDGAVTTNPRLRSAWVLLYGVTMRRGR
jgi:hypothetical protein